MRFKESIFVLVFLMSLSYGMAYSPAQIIEVTDNFGNTYDVESNFGHDGTFARITNDEQEVIVSDETEITFCVTEVEHEEDRELEYYFNHWSFNDTGWQSDNCATFDGYTEEDWDANEWSFEIYMRDDSDNTARNADVEGGYDFQFQPRYSNLVLPGESNTELDTTVYDTIRVSKSEYENLQKDSEELESKESEINSLEDELNQKESTIDEKDSKIEELNQEVNEKESKISEMNSTIEELNTTIQNLEGKVEEPEGGFLSKISRNPGNRTDKSLNPLTGDFYQRKINGTTVFLIIAIISFGVYGAREYLK